MKQASFNNQYFCDSLSQRLDFYSSTYNKKAMFGDFSLETSHLVMLSFMNNKDVINLVKVNAYFKGKGSCIDLKLTSGSYYFKIPLPLKQV